MNDHQAEGKEKMQKDATTSSRSSDGGRQSPGSRSSKRSHRSRPSQSRKNSEDQTTSNNVTSKRRHDRSPNRGANSRRRDNEGKERTSRRSSGEQKERKPLSSSSDNIRLLEDRNEASADTSVARDRQDSGLQPSQGGGDIPPLPLASPSPSAKKRVGGAKSPRSPKSPRRYRKPSSDLQPSQSGGDISIPFDSPGASVKKRTRNPKSPQKRPKSPHHQGTRRHKSNDKSKSTSVKTSSPAPRLTTSNLSTGDATGIVDDGAAAFMAETVDEQSESNRERMRDLEVQSDQIQRRMQDAIEEKPKKGKNGETGQDTTSNGGRRITICKVLGIAAVYIAGVGTGFLVSELRRRRSSPAKEIYVTQSPTAAVVPSSDPTTAPTEFSYDDPTKEDCFAIESKEEVEGQDGMITRSYDVHFDVQLNDGSTNWYGQLEEGVTIDVIPDLACCKVAPTEQRRLVVESMELSMGGRNRMLRNIRCVVANGSTRGEHNDNDESCVELTGGLCLPAVVTFDLTLKGDEANSDIIDLVRNVINGDGSEPLVEKFDLERNIFSVAYNVSNFDLCTWVATQSPTTRPASPKPTLRVTQSPTTAPAPGVTPRPTPGPSPQPTPNPTSLPTSEPSRGPSESPSSMPTLVPTRMTTSSPTISPTTSAPSLTPSAAPTGRREVLEAILIPIVGTVDTAVLDWLADSDTWSPPVTEADPDFAWAERYAMVKFYLVMNGDAWKDKWEWMSSSTICDWSPDTCNGQNRVRKIDLSNNGLSGTVPTEIEWFPNLDFFEINNNGIRGTLPTEIGLSKLTHLKIHNNDISGTIPSELGLLTGMTVLDFTKNSLTGSIPPEVLSLSNMRWLILQNNRLTGTIGSELGAMREVLHINLYNNQFSGSLPSEIGLLTKLTYISIKNCPFTGLIPSELGLLTTLLNMNFDNNNLSGTFPTTLSQLTKLTSLQLQRTILNGNVPTELGRMTALTALDLHNTNLSGTIPSEINLLTNLRYLKIERTEVFGTIPDLSALVNLDTLSFSKCKLTGSIPPGMFNNMLQLEFINLSNNNLTGGIPAIPNPSLLTICSYSNNCFTTDLANAGSCDLTNNCV